MPMDFPASPTIGQQYNGYVWDGVAWDSTSAQPIALSTTAPGYNAIINGGMDIWQRGTTFTRASNAGADYGSADRWKAGSFGAAAPAITLARATDIPSDIGLTYSAQMSWAASTSTGDVFLAYLIENGKYLFAGKTVTLSFYAKAASNVTVGVAIDQDYGGSNVSLTTSWTRYQLSWTLPTTYQSSRPSGTNPSNNVELRMFRMANTNTAANTITFTGVQLEEGGAATAFRRNAPSIQAELAACQRYYFRKVADSNYTNFGIGRADATNSAICVIPFPVPMRAIPATVNESSAASTFMLEGLGGAIPATSVAGPIGVRNSTTSGSLYLGTAGSLTSTTLYLLTSNVNSTAYVAFSAEL